MYCMYEYKFIYALCGGRSVELKISDIYNSLLNVWSKGHSIENAVKALSIAFSLQEHKHTITN